MARPDSKNSLAEKELDKAEKQFDKFDDEIKSMTKDRMDMTPKPDLEPQTKIATADLDKMQDIYLKPHKTISCRDKFNEDYRKDYEFAKEYVNFIAENKEIIGEDIDIWTRPFSGMPAEWWKVPVNTPVWGPRYLAEQIKRKFYHRLEMKETVSGDNVSGSTGFGAMYGKMAVDTTIQRLDAHPVNASRKSVFMGADGS